MKSRFNGAFWLTATHHLPTGSTPIEMHQQFWVPITLDPHLIILIVCFFFLKTLPAGNFFIYFFYFCYYLFYFNYFFLTLFFIMHICSMFLSQASQCQHFSSFWQENAPVILALKKWIAPSLQWHSGISFANEIYVGATLFTLVVVFENRCFTEFLLASKPFPSVSYSITSDQYWIPFKIVEWLKISANGC